MKIILIGATGTIGAKVADALSAKKHEVIRASRNGDIKVNLDDRATIRALFERVNDVDALVSCAGNAAFKPFSQLTDADYQLGLRSKLMGQVSAGVGYGPGTRPFCRRRGEGVCGRSRRFPARSDIRPAPVCLDTGAFSTDPPPTRLTGRQKRRKDVVLFQRSLSLSA